MHACHLDVLALLARLSLVAPAEFAGLAKEADPGLSLPGDQGDIALVAGDFDGAVEQYVRELRAVDARPATWAGLGLALRERGEPDAGRSLIQRPELARALSGALPWPYDPLELARGLAGVH